MEDIKPGDLVVLKSGGPKMVVFDVENAISVIWMNKNDDLQFQKLTADVLSKLDDPGVVKVR